MSSKFEKQIICILHSQHDCAYRRSYARGCDLKIVDDFATAQCPYRIEATVLAAAKQEESPVSDVQQPQYAIAAALAPDSVTGESAIKQCLPICNACGKIMSLESIEMGIKGHRFICACGHKFNAVLVEQSLYDSVPSKKDGILPLEKGKCDDCFYWEQLETDLAGKCRRYPPVRFPGEDYDDYYFPCPQSNTWCGEFKRKVTAES